MSLVFRRLTLSAVLALLLLMSACASSINRAPGNEYTQVTFGENQQASGISISLTPEAQKIAATTIRFDQQVLLRQIKQLLDQKKALATATDQALPTIEILITSIRSRSAFNAVMFGFMAGDDHINGTVIVRSATGDEMQRFDVKASYALGGLAGGQTDARMGWLYETFAKHVADELTGVVQPKPSDSETPSS